MNKQLAQRLERLEQRLAPQKLWRLVWVDPLDEHRRGALAPGERIVLDEYGECGGVILARERITTDPLDNGLLFPMGDDSEDVIPEAA